MDQRTYGDMLIPPFLGTGEMLTWETTVLLDRIDKNRLFTDYWRIPESSTDTPDAEAMLDRLLAIARKPGLVEARGYYGFFQVITEGTRIILLNPSDNSTGVAEIETAAANGSGLVPWLRPEGDLVGLAAVTLGPGQGSLVDAEDSDRLAGLGACVADDLCGRIVVELRRALFLDQGQGEYYPAGCPHLPFEPNARSLGELMCIEDRLGVTVAGAAAFAPPHSRLCLYLAHGPARSAQQ